MYVEWIGRQVRPFLLVLSLFVSNRLADWPFAAWIDLADMLKWLRSDKYIYICTYINIWICMHMPLATCSFCTWFQHYSLCASSHSALGYCAYWCQSMLLWPLGFSNNLFAHQDFFVLYTLHGHEKGIIYILLSLVLIFHSTSIYNFLFRN